MHGRLDGGSRPARASRDPVVIESAQPAISETHLTGLAAHYGFGPDDPRVAYFALRAERDLEHADASGAALAAEATEGDADRLVATAEAALRGNWRLLDGVEAA